MEYGKSCSFTGHRPLKLPWKYNEEDPRCVDFKLRLYAVIEAVYDSGISHFISGMALGCDMYCAEAVIKLREEHPEVTLEAAVPYRAQAEKWGEKNRERYQRLLEACDEVNVLQEDYTPSCMMRRNRYLVDQSSVLVACYDGMRGGTWNTIKYAMDKDKEVVQLALE